MFPADSLYKETLVREVTYALGGYMHAIMLKD